MRYIFLYNGMLWQIPKVGARKGAGMPPEVGFNSNREVERPGELLSVLVQIARRLYLKRLFGRLKWQQRSMR